MRADITVEQLEHIALLTDNGLTAPKIAAIMNLNVVTVRNVVSIYVHMKNGEPVTETSKSRYPAAIKWACGKFGKNYNEIMNRKPAAPEPKEDNTALAFATMLEAIKALTEAVNAIDTRLSAMQMTLSGTRDEARQDTKKIVEAININGDILTKEWQAMKEKLEAIKMNTRSLRRNNE
jgi:hypothetical protein